MAKRWQQYQEETADLFRRLGADVTVDATLKGVRAKHAVDVLVRSRQFGVDITWIVECKRWRTAVPKEKVHTLHSIAQDVGADRAFLFSESGFQAGAIAAARHTNITLTSVQAFSETTDADVLDIMAATLGRQLQLVSQDVGELLWEPKGRGRPRSLRGPAFDNVVTLLSTLLLLRLGMTQALASQFPVQMDDATGLGFTVRDPRAFTEAAFKVLDDVKRRTQDLGRINLLVGPEATEVGHRLIEAVRVLLDVGEVSLFSEHGCFCETDRRRALNAMQEVGRQADEARLTVGVPARTALRKLMQSLIDTIYLHLAQPQVEQAVWKADRAFVEARLGEFARRLGP